MTPARPAIRRSAVINRGNVGRLALAWSYDTGEKGDTQTQPIVVGRVMYAYTPTHKTVALDAASGKLLWTFDSGLNGVGANRGLLYWSDGKDARVFAAVDNFVYALDPVTGKPVESFGHGGRIDLREDLGRDPGSQSVRLTTPGVVWHDLLILGGRVAENLPASPGHVRAWDVRSGALRWTFHTIPQPGEPGYDTWPRDAWQYTGGANSWSGITLDEKRGLVFVPTGSAAADFYGANRLGDNLYANCLLALDAATGRLRWHYQFVRHDLLDRDLPSAPTLITLKLKGHKVDALAQTTKQGYVFVLDRDTGKPVFPVDEVPAPATDVPGEVSYPSYLRPRSPTPLARQQLTADDLTTRTPEANRWAREQFAAMRSDGPFKPLTVGIDTTIYPGLDGGAEWGGPAWDPDTGLLYVNANEMSWLGSLAPNDNGRNTGKTIYLRECAACHRDDLQGSPPQFPALAGLGARLTPAQFTERVKQWRRPHAGVSQPAGRGHPGAGALRVRWPGPARGRPDAFAHQSRVPFHRLPSLAGSGGLPGRGHALGHVDGHRPGQGKIRLAHSVRRVPRARGTRPARYRQRELRRTAGDARRPAVHRRQHPRPQVPRLRQAHRQTTLGVRAALLRRCHPGHLPGGWPPVRGHLRQRRQGTGRIRWRRVSRLRVAARNGRSEQYRPRSGARHESRAPRSSCSSADRWDQARRRTRDRGARRSAGSDTAVRSIIRLRSAVSLTLALEIGFQKLGQPVPDSNLFFESNSAVSQQMQRYRPSA